MTESTKLIVIGRNDDKIVDQAKRLARNIRDANLLHQDCTTVTMSAKLFIILAKSANKVNTQTAVNNFIMLLQKQLSLTMKDYNALLEKELADVNFSAECQALIDLWEEEEDFINNDLP